VFKRSWEDREVLDVKKWDYILVFVLSFCYRFWVVVIKKEDEVNTQEKYVEEYRGYVIYTNETPNGGYLYMAKNNVSNLPSNRLRGTIGQGITEIRVLIDKEVGEGVTDPRQSASIQPHDFASSTGPR